MRHHPCFLRGEESKWLIPYLLGVANIKQESEMLHNPCRMGFQGFPPASLLIKFG